MLRTDRLVVSLAGLTLTACAATAQEPAKTKVARHVPSEKLEAILRDMGIKYEKSSGKDKGIDYYDFQRHDVKVRLHNYHGKDLWLDVPFTDQLSLEDVNAWNMRSKFSRAVQLTNGPRTITSLEAQLDCLGGVTDAMIRQFIKRFDSEIQAFVQFLAK
ncbi:MAG: YbjN domain-containing protein [Gemmataceae bacterium]|nr:YbjN domain-containing protein [Gemmataceae bacterium]